jgi:hypothetical protein
MSIGKNWHMDKVLAACKVGNLYLHRRYKLIAWFKDPLPRNPFNSEVIGTKDIEITSGSAWTLFSHSPLYQTDGPIGHNHACISERQTY